MLHRPRKSCSSLFQGGRDGLWAASRGLLLLCASAMLLASSPALAKKVVLLDFKGKGSQVIQKSIQEKLADSHDVVSQDEVQTEAAKLGLGTNCDETNIMGMASVFGAEGVICGTITGPAGNRKLEVVVHNGGDAQEVARFIVSVGKWGLDKGVVDQVKQQCDAALAKTWSWDTGGGGDAGAPTTPDPAPAPKPKPRPEPRPKPEPEPATAPASGGSAEPDVDLDTPPDPVDGSGGTTEGAAKDPAPLGDQPGKEDAPMSVASMDDDNEDPLARGARSRHKVENATVEKEETAEPGRVDGTHALRLGVGLALRLMRGFKYHYPNPKAGKPNEPDLLTESYNPTIGAGVSLDAELFPGAFLTKGIGRNLGIGIRYDFFYGPGWQMASERVSHNITQHDLDLTARFRYPLPFLESRVPWIGIKFGWYLVKLDMNDEATQALYPDVALSGLDAGLMLGIGLYPEYLHLFGNFSFIPLLAYGELAGADQKFGKAGFSYGLDMGGGLRGKLWGGVGWRLGVQYLRYTFKYEADPSIRWNPDIKDRLYVISAKDSYLNMMLLVTYTN